MPVDRPAPPLLLSALACLALPLLGGCAEPDPVSRSNILLITIDTLRADHLSSYGYPRQTSPVLDRLAAEGVRFELPIVQWPKTGPSFASIFTSTYPKDNGIVRKIGEQLPLEFRMLAEVLAGQGYATFAVVSNGAVASEFNFHQGFDNFVESWKLSPTSPGQDPTGAEMVTQLALTVMAGHRPQAPYFLWVHYLDPHFPYEAPAPWTDRFEGDSFYDGSRKIEISQERPRRQMTGIGFEQTLGGRDELAYYVARYDAEIAYVDSQVGRLLDGLSQQDLLENTLTVVTSDHGESLGEHHYYFDHGRFGFQTCLRVPLIFHYPPALTPRVDAEPVELIHLTPTLLEAAGVTLEGRRWMQGRSLWPRLQGRGVREEAERYAYSEAGYALDRAWQRIVTDGRFKLVQAFDPAEQMWLAGEGNRLALYDLVSDPGETQNLTEQAPEQAMRLDRALSELWSSPDFPVKVEPAARGPRREMEEETRRQLEALGYLQ